MIILNIGNSFIPNQDKIEQQKQFELDTLKYTKIITQLESQRSQDSLSILELKSIRTQVADNAIKELEEQRLA